MNKNKTLIAILGLGMSSGCISKATDPMQAILAKRHSGYAYDSSRPVSHEQIQQMVKAAQSAPSCYNDQPWFFIVCDRATQPDAYNKVLNALVEFNQQWAQSAPVLIVVAAGMNSREGGHNHWAQYDSGAAAVCMMLQATSLGLMAHQMAGFDPAKISASFELPADVMPMAVMAVGYEASETKVKARERKPQEQNFFAGSWGNGIR